MCSELVTKMFAVDCFVTTTCNSEETAKKLPRVPHVLYLWMVGLNLQLWYHFIQTTTI